MKTIIAGSRTINDPLVLVEAIVQSRFFITEVVHGGAKGADRLGFDWAIQNGITIKTFRANWDAHGRAAGPMRNREMAAYAEALIALWDGKSKGTSNMIEEAKKRGLRIYVHEVSA